MTRINLGKAYMGRFVGQWQTRRYLYGEWEVVKRSRHGPWSVYRNNAHQFVTSTLDDVRRRIALTEQEEAQCPPASPSP